MEAVEGVEGVESVESVVVEGDQREFLDECWWKSLHSSEGVW